MYISKKYTVLINVKKKCSHMLTMLQYLLLPKTINFFSTALYIT